jgi:hypothetical protein
MLVIGEDRGECLLAIVAVIYLSMSMQSEFEFLHRVLAMLLFPEPLLPIISTFLILLEFPFHFGTSLSEKLKCLLYSYFTLLISRSVNL